MFFRLGIFLLICKRTDNCKSLYDFFKKNLKQAENKTYWLTYIYFIKLLRAAYYFHVDDWNFFHLFVARNEISGCKLRVSLRPLLNFCRWDLLWGADILCTLHTIHIHHLFPRKPITRNSISICFVIHCT